VKRLKQPLIQLLKFEYVTKNEENIKKERKNTKRLM